jgi:hypothetical protein
MRRSGLAIQACAVALFAALLPVSLRAQSPFPGTVPGSEIGLGLPAGFESSGAVWHVRLERLFVVDDGGTLACMDAQGGALQAWSLAGRDLEAVCVADPGTDFVYLGVEHPDSIVEFDLSTGLVTREFDLTFARDPTHAEGGLFYAGFQADGRVYEFELSIASSAVLAAVTHLSTLVPAPTFDDISGLD